VLFDAPAVLGVNLQVPNPDANHSEFERFHKILISSLVPKKWIQKW